MIVQRPEKVRSRSKTFRILLVTLGIVLSLGLAIANAGVSEPLNLAFLVLITSLPFVLCGVMYRSIVWSALAGVLMIALLIWMYVSMMSTQSSTEGLVILIYFPLALLVAALGLAFDHYFDERKGRG